MMMYKLFFKRFFDIIISFSCLVVLAPLLILVSVIIFLQDGHNPFFLQDRVGKSKTKFRIFKFRSMPISTVEVESADVDKIKITKFGHLIRETNIDELPQLLNIFIGDMSIVGPRPCLLSQQELISLRLKGKAYYCRPGLTGLAQVNSYDNISNSAKADFDNQYASKISFINDVKIILSTFSYLTKKNPTY